MAKFHESAPTRVWKFGCRAPRINAELINDQFYLAFRYYNRLVQIENQRRDDIQKVVHEFAPELAGLEQAVEDVNARIKDARDAIAARNMKDRSRTGSMQDRKHIKDLTKQRTEARTKVRKVRERLWGKALEKKPGEKKPRRRKDEPIRILRQGGNRKFLQAIEVIENAFNKTIRHTRGQSQLAWGTYLLTEKAWKQACETTPFGHVATRRWNGNGTLGVQLQGGMSRDEVFAGEDSRLRLVMQEGHRSARGQNGQVFLRIGSEGRQPLFAQFAFRLHRQLPERASIKWAAIVRRRIGDYYRYWLDLTFSSPDGFDKHDRAEDGIVAVNVGWRLLEDGSLRVATWVGMDGAGNMDQGHLIIPAKSVDRWRWADSLRSLRDRMFNSVRDLLKVWLKGFEAVKLWVSENRTSLHDLSVELDYLPYPGLAADSLQWKRLRNFRDTFCRLLQKVLEIETWSGNHYGHVPEWLSAACEHIHAWRSPARLAQLLGSRKLLHVPRPDETPVARWQHSRFSGDEEMFAIADAWRDLDIYLWNWEANQRRKAVCWRDKLYEMFAVQLRRRYLELRIANIDHQKLARRAAPEEDKEAVQQVRFHRWVASPGRVGEKLRDSFTKKHCVEIAAEMLTQECYQCGNEEPWDAAKSIRHTCSNPGCRHTFDQDVCHCYNLLGWVHGDKRQGGPPGTLPKRKSRNKDDGQAVAG